MRTTFTRSASAQRLEHDRVDALDAVDALLEVRRAGPVGERLLEVAVVAEPREPLRAARAASVVVDVDPVLLRRGAEELLVQREQAAQLRDRPLVVVDAQVDDGVGELRVAGVLLDDEQ